MKKKHTHLRTPGDYLTIRTETGDLAFGGRIYIYYNAWKYEKNTRVYQNCFLHVSFRPTSPFSSIKKYLCSLRTFQQERIYQMYWKELSFPVWRGRMTTKEFSTM